jgi:hypothetical protein
MMKAPQHFGLLKKVKKWSGNIAFLISFLLLQFLSLYLSIRRFGQFLNKLDFFGILMLAKLGLDKHHNLFLELIGCPLPASAEQRP